MKKKHYYRYQKGFTLLEVIVTLMIASLISVILMQSMSTMLNMRYKFKKELMSTERVGIQNSIITSPLLGIFPDFNDGEYRFSGEKKSIRGLTLTPLQGTTGAPTGFGMDIIYDSSSNSSKLIYKEKGFESIEIAQWSGDNGSFEYKGNKGKWSNRWPIQNDLKDQTPRTLKFNSNLTQKSYVIRVTSTADRIIRLKDTPFKNETSR